MLAVLLAGGAVACGGEWTPPDLESPDADARNALWEQLLDAGWLEARAARIEDGGPAWNPERLMLLDGTGGAALLPPEPFRPDGIDPVGVSKDALLSAFPEIDPDLVRGYVAFDHGTPQPVPELATVLPLGRLSRDDWAEGRGDLEYFQALREVHPDAEGVLEVSLPVVSEPGDEALVCAMEARGNRYTSQCGRFLLQDGHWSLDGGAVELWTMFVDYF